MRSPLFIDKISFTIDVPDAHTIDIDRFFEVEKETEHRFVFIADYSKLMNYQRGGQWRLRQSDEGTVLVHWKPRFGDGRDGTRRYLRIECNPSKLHLGCIRTIYDALESWLGLGMTFDKFVNDARFTRFDLTFDVRISIEELIVFQLLRKSNSRTYVYPSSKMHPHGNISSHTIGGANSDRQMVVYDKNLQLGNAVTYGGLSGSCLSVNGVLIPIVRRTHPRTRFELTLKNVNSLENLFGMKNPFENYHVKQVRTLGNKLPKHKFLFFLDSCKIRGAQAALSLIADQRERTRYANAIKEVPSPKWWDPEIIRNELPNALIRILVWC